ncbi:MAG: response regulator [Leptodesmis sp.]
MGTVLIIDDTPDNLRVLIATLTRHGYNVSVATSGELALARLEDIKPDLILLDIQMVNMDGYQVCERLKSQSSTRSIPVIFISAAYEVLDKVRAFEAGAADYITKPIQLEETLARIEHQLRIRNLQKRLEEQNVQLQQEVQLRRQTEQQLESLSTSLEQQVQMRTAQLEQAYQFEATLKRITDRVRDSLDEAHILQTAVEELAQAIGAESCNASLYDLERRTSTVCYEYTTTSAVLQGRVLEMANFAEGYEELLQGQYFQFCSLQPHPSRQQPAMLACPILDDHRVFGDL